MKKQIDCILIGYNEINFENYEKLVLKKGVNSGSYQYINTSFFKYNNRIYNTSSIFDYFAEGKIKSITHSDNFSLTIAYLGTFLTKNNISIDYINSFQDEKERLKTLLQENEVRSIAITTTFYISPLPMFEIINFIRGYNSKVKIIVGGPYILNQIKSLNNEELNFVFKSIGADFFINNSQGEEALVKIINNIKNSLHFDKINNIYFLDGHEYKATKFEEENNDLSENIVEWGMFKNSINYGVAVRTSLSCPFSCSFCSFPENAGKYRTVKTGKIEKELDNLENTGKVKCIYFIDDTFNIPVERFKNLLRMIIKKKYSFKWYSFFRCQFADEEMVLLMKESGCLGVFLGIESGCDVILKNMNKKVMVSEYLRGINLLKNAGLLTFASFIIGFPGETEVTVAETVDFIEKSGIDFYRAYIWFCDTNTPIYRQKDKYKIIGSDFEWSHSSMDWKKAYQLRNNIYLNTKSSIFLPDFRYDFENILYLMDRGIDLQLIKLFLQSFNNAIKEKIIFNNDEISSAALDEIRDKVINLTYSYLQDKKQLVKQLKNTSVIDADFKF